MPNATQLTALVRQAADGALQVHIDRVYSFNELPQALMHLRSGGMKGKLVVHVSGDSNA